LGRRHEAAAATPSARLATSRAVPAVPGRSMAFCVEFLVGKMVIFRDFSGFQSPSDQHHQNHGQMDLLGFPW
jgi:hypothetical protein